MQQIYRQDDSEPTIAPSLTLTVIEREATQILADFRTYSETAMRSDLEEAPGAVGVVAKAEIVRIGQRLSRSFLWVFLNHESAGGKMTSGERGGLGDLLAGCDALQADCKVHIAPLPRSLQRLSQRSHALFERVRRLQASMAAARR